LDIQTKLQEYPFTRPSIENLPKQPSLDAVALRQSIRRKLRSAMTPSEKDFKFMKEHPEEAEWLKAHVESRF
jgi:hypothetical protein